MVFNTVSVIDGATYSLVTTIPVGVAPRGISLDPVRNRLYVANTGYITVSVIDGATNSVVEIVNLPDYPLFIAANPATNKIYATLPYSHQVAVISYPPPVIPVTIDIVPGSPRNLVVPWLSARIAVAIISDDSFDAASVDASSVRFGPLGAAPVSSTLRNVGGSKQKDLVLQFNLRSTGINCGETGATLVGSTQEGTAIEGTDAIRTVLCIPSAPAPE